MNTWKYCVIVVIASCFCLYCGCSQSSQPHYESLGIVEVSGTIRLDGKPLQNVEVRFENADEGIYSFGVTNDGGGYKLMFDSRKSGVIPGKKRVIVVKKSKSEADMSQEDDEGDGKSKSKDFSSIPACYGRDSKILVEVKEGESSFDFDLKSDCSTMDRSR